MLGITTGMLREQKHQGGSDPCCSNARSISLQPSQTQREKLVDIPVNPVKPGKDPLKLANRGC